MRRLLLLLLPLAASAASTLHAAGTPDPNAWLAGVWEKTLDEDRSPPDTMKFLSNGTFVSYGPNCEERIFPYHVHAGRIYLDIEIPGKGPVALVFRPDAQHKKLTFTSPRTMHNAIYERVAKPTCGG